VTTTKLENKPFSFQREALFFYILTSFFCLRFKLWIKKLNKT